MTILPDPPSESRVISQHNEQTLHVHVHHTCQTPSLLGGIAGVVVRAEGGLPVAGSMLQLFFGPVGDHPVATATSAPTGAFAFEYLPPGFYGLRLRLPEGHLIHLHNLRVLPGERCEPRLVVSEREQPERALPDGDLVELVTRGIRFDRT